MLERSEVKVSTDNTGINGEGGEKVPVSVEITVTVPESLAEASDFYGGESKLLDVIQAETVRRKINAARAMLRTETNPNTDWAALATKVAESYTPGRRGGFQAPQISEDELASVAGDFDALMSLLQSRNVQVTG